MFASVSDRDFDLAEADFEGNVTCLGNNHAINLPVLGDFDPETVTMQQLRAKSQYGGGKPGQHVGGFCASKPVVGPPCLALQGTTVPGLVAVDQSPGALVNIDLSNARL